MATLLSNDANKNLSDTKAFNVAVVKTAQVTSKITKIESVNALVHIATAIVASGSTGRVIRVTSAARFVIINKH